MRRPVVAGARRWLGPAVLLAAGAYMLRLSWLRWPDILIDYGTELYVPWQLAQGKVLYRDVGNGFGPLADYVNALLFRLFNVVLVAVLFLLLPTSRVRGDFVFPDPADARLLRDDFSRAVDLVALRRH